MNNEQILVEALQRIINMNIQYCIDKYGDADKAENMSCVKIAREAILIVMNKTINNN